MNLELRPEKAYFADIQTLEELAELAPWAGYYSMSEGGMQAWLYLPDGHEHLGDDIKPTGF